MKKLFITFSMFLAVNVIDAMERQIIRSNTGFKDDFDTQPVTCIKGNMCIVPSDPVYIGDGDFYLNKLHNISLLLGSQVNPNEPVQAVLAWNDDNESFYPLPPKVEATKFPNFSAHPPKWNTKFPLYLPLSRLQDLKEGEQLLITIDGQDYKLTANQLKSKFNYLGNFQSALARYKQLFIQNPTYIADSENELLVQGILARNAFGRVNHGPNGWQEAQTLSTKVKRNPGKFFSFFGLSVVAVGYAWWKGHIQTSSFFSAVGQWASRFFAAKS